ncbi:MAG: NmrA family transcriptional regulator [Myxococcales bacterium FL481]|nr:MAG: NmrA family transcriptional regulator [Myxococcales bacterium FL481]
MNAKQLPANLTLVLGASGKTGRRIVQRLAADGVPTRPGSRTGIPPFDWNHPAGWDACLTGVHALYISYTPDLAMPGARDAIQHLVSRAEDHGLQRLVLLSGRGEEEAQRCEDVVLASRVPATVIRASWFNQNFSEGAFAEMVKAGRITLPAGDVPEPFVDADDIADVARAALTQDGHTGEVYEVTGPRSLGFSEVAAELAQATGQPIDYQPVTHDAFVSGIKRSGAPKEVVWMLDYLFATVLDGRNAKPTSGVSRALGRPPKDFTAYARQAAASGVWS